MRIIIADDHAIVRKGVKFILREEFDDVFCDEASTGDEFIQKIKAEDYDIALLDIVMPGKDVIDSIKLAKTYKPKLPILVFSMNPEKPYASRLIKAGADGYLRKESPPEEILVAVKRVLSGKTYISPELSEVFASELRGESSKAPHENLSDREFQILILIASGLSLSDIAEKLFLSKNTVSNHRNSLLKKLGLKNNSELTIYALKNNLIS